VAAGSEAWLRLAGGARAGELARGMGNGGAGRAGILIGLAGQLAGFIVMGDHLRPDALELVPRLRRAGSRHVALTTGDRVVLNPWLSCGPRGIDPPCPACVARTKAESGFVQLCAAGLAHPDFRRSYETAPHGLCLSHLDAVLRTPDGLANRDGLTSLLPDGGFDSGTVARTEHRHYWTR